MLGFILGCFFGALVAVVAIALITSNQERGGHE